LGAVSQFDLSTGAAAAAMPQAVTDRRYIRGDYKCRITCN
jgi:hypothetical protein